MHPKLEAGAGTRAEFGRLAILALVFACSSGGSQQNGQAGAGGAGGGSAGTAGSTDHPVVAGKPVALMLASDDQQVLDDLGGKLDAERGLTSDDLLKQRALTYASGLGYDPSSAEGLSAIQASALALDSDEQALLAQNGFVVSAKKTFPTMLYGYATIYVEDLPLYVSADSILDSVHRSYDTMLEYVEEQQLIGGLGSLLDDMRSQLAHRNASDVSAQDADFFLAVSASLLEGSAAAPVLKPSLAKDVQGFVSKAMAAQGTEQRELFGVQREIDFSQFEPRGHYTHSDMLGRYFRAMMWLGRVELRLIETQPNGKQVFYRRQLEAAIALRGLLTNTGLERWRAIDAALAAFVGQSDYMRVPEIDSLLKDLGATGADGLAAIDDQTIAQTIIDKGYGSQLIASQLITNQTPDNHTLPLDRSFALFGQRYVVDSHVFSNVVYDRVPDRLMPNPLDVAYAGFGADQAVALLEPELKRYPYAGALESMRLLIDAYDDDFWNANLYNLWLRSLRALAPKAAETQDPASAGLPAVAGSEPWGRRLLNTQLGSWAELRHDTILYAKQSYTTGPVCSFPDAYVDPYPEFYAALVSFADRGSALADALAGSTSSSLAQELRAYFANLKDAMEKLGGMADAERKGDAFTDEQMAFINQAIHRLIAPCGAPPRFDGWYAALTFTPGGPSTEASSDIDLTIADVHTQPKDAAGNDVGRILHVATGEPRLMVVTTDTCGTPRAYAGLALAYYETITEHWKRLTDQDWTGMLVGKSTLNGFIPPKNPPPDVPWTASYVSGTK